MHKPSIDDLNPAQRARLLAFKTKQGRTWRFDLSVMWVNGKDGQQHDGHLLRQIRNDFGPDWLRKVTVPV